MAKKKRQITVLDQDGSLSTGLDYIKEVLNSQGRVVTVDTSTALRALVRSAAKYFKRLENDPSFLDKVEEINIEDIFS